MSRELEIIQHTTGARLAPTQGHNTHSLSAVANTVRQELAIKCRLSNGPKMPYCKYEPQSVAENFMDKLYYDSYITVYT